MSLDRFVPSERLLKLAVQRFQHQVERREMPGVWAFHLMSTHGIPREIVEEICADEGWNLDVRGLEAYLRQEREISWAASKFSEDVLVR